MRGINNPVVSPDGKTVYFDWQYYDRAGKYHLGLFSVPIEGGDHALIEQDSLAYHTGMRVTPDGKHLVYVAGDGYTVDALPVSGGASHVVVDNHQIDNFGQLDISPDGQTVVMSGAEWGSAGGSFGLYTAPFSATTTAEAQRIPGTTLAPAQDPDTNEQSGVYSPAFSPDSQAIAYLASRHPNGGPTYSEVRAGRRRATHRSGALDSQLILGPGMGTSGNALGGS